MADYDGVFSHLCIIGRTLGHQWLTGCAIKNRALDPLDPFKPLDTLRLIRPFIPNIIMLGGEEEIGTILCAERWCCPSSLLGYWAQSWTGRHSDTVYQHAGTHFTDLGRMTGRVNPTWY